MRELTEQSMKASSLQQENELPLSENQFTCSELLQYMQKAYSAKLNGNAFRIEDILLWLHAGKISAAYGGNTITSKRMSGLRILTVSGLSREDLKDVDVIAEMRQQMTKAPEGISQERKHKAASKIPRRTALYYQMLKIPAPPDVLPDNFKAYGIKGNQLSNRKKKKK